jgi:Ribbon-helix-helix protein, copG family
MKRTQLYLEDESWKALHVRSKESGLSISELVRQAIRDRYLSPVNERRAAMQAIIGIWKDRSDLPDTEAYVRDLRRNRRSARIRK